MDLRLGETGVCTLETSSGRVMSGRNVPGLFRLVRRISHSLVIKSRVSASSDNSYLIYMSLRSSVSYAVFQQITNTQLSPLSQPERSLLTHPEGVWAAEQGLEDLLTHTSAICLSV